VPTRYLELEKQSIRLVGARLVVTRGPDRGRSLRIDRELVTVGAAGSNDLALTDDTVSQHHLSLRVLPHGYLVTDLESTNGTLLGKNRIRSAEIEPGDTLILGATRLRLEALGDESALPLSQASGFGKLVGRSPEARRLFAVLEAVAPQDTTVLLVGETGTGKDLAAQALHDASPRADKPFVVVDCNSVPPNLLEADLFGYEAGALSGTTGRGEGALMEAQGGTIFFDEITKLPLDLQPKLLRAIETREARALGSNTTRRLDVRIIAASDRDLGIEVNRGTFREDLFYRLNVVRIVLPPLRERPDDVPILANHFYRQLTRDDAAVLPPATIARLLLHRWPGNARELRNTIEQMVALTDVAGADEPTPTPTETPATYQAARGQVVAEFERAFLVDLLNRTGGNVSQGARLADMDRVYLIKLLRKHGLSRQRGADAAATNAK
jgi:DNA-binding NtrC family response regulator